jgi:hypothetical protein
MPPTACAWRCARAWSASSRRERRLAQPPSTTAAKYEITARLRRKEADFERALTLAHRLTAEATSDDGDVVPGQPFNVHTRVWNQGMEAVTLLDVALRVPSGMDGGTAGRSAR